MSLNVPKAIRLLRGNTREYIPDFRLGKDFLAKKLVSIRKKMDFNNPIRN